MTVSEAIRIRLRELIRESGLTVTGVADMGGMSRSCVDNFTDSRYKSHNVASLKKICDTLMMDLSEFFDSPLFDDLEPD